ncbi:MAG: hypothetical protein AB7O48_19160 [Cyclobacteriaceae bacterium]
MNRRRLIFFVIFGVYHLVIFVFTSYIDVQKQDLGVLTSMYKFIHLFKYGAFLGIALFITDFVWSWRERKMAEKETESLKFEVNTLKAKVYDLQEAAKPTTGSQPEQDSQ